MIYDNTIVFGYGSVSVTAIPDKQTIVFQELQTSCDVGEAINLANVKAGDISLEFPLTYELHKEFLKNLDDVINKRTSKFTFCGCVFDFSEYKLKSIMICKNKAMEAMRHYLLYTAC